VCVIASSLRTVAAWSSVKTAKSSTTEKQTISVTSLPREELKSAHVCCGLFPRQTFAVGMQSVEATAWLEGARMDFEQDDQRGLGGDAGIQFGVVASSTYSRLVPQTPEKLRGKPHLSEARF
jgi:hypothetical protein